jgi:hypothetical protein
MRSTRIVSRVTSTDDGRFGMSHNSGSRRGERGRLPDDSGATSHWTGMDAANSPRAPLRYPRRTLTSGTARNEQVCSMGGIGLSSDGPLPPNYVEIAKVLKRGVDLRR